MYQIVFIRHGQSEWNKENRFTGWHDVDLSTEGCEEARTAGKLLREQGYVFDRAFTSVLKRAIRTLWLILDEMDLMWIPVEHSWQLNERHYGALTGLDKSETTAKYGAEQVHQWRRGYAILPPALGEKSPYHPRNDPKYTTIERTQLPSTESLATTVNRVVPYWKKEIAPRIQKGEKIIVAAHGNSLRALIKYLDQVSDEEITELNIPTGTPLVYELDRDLQPLRHDYLGDANKIAAAMKAVANQAGRNPVSS